MDRIYRRTEVDALSSAAVPAAVVAAPRRHCVQRSTSPAFSAPPSCAGEGAHATAGETPALLNPAKSESLR